jgi:hypothetical protein
LSCTLRRVHREATGTDDFLALGLIALWYGIALLVHAYGFLAVFAAGVAIRRIERRASNESPEPPHVGQGEAHETDARLAPAYMAETALTFNAQLDRASSTA